MKQSSWLFFGLVALGLLVPAFLIKRTMDAAFTVEQWHLGSPAPLAADLDGDGVEDFVGGWTEGQIVSPQTHAAAFSGATFEPLWTVPLSAEPHVFVRAMDMDDDTLLVLASDGQVLLLDPRTGASLRPVPPEAAAGIDAVTRVCLSPDGAGAWGEHPQGGMALDLATGQGVPADRPAWCPKPAEPRSCWVVVDSVEGTASGCTGQAPRIPAIRDFAPQLLLEQDRLQVVVGHRQSGAQLPVAVGLDGERVRWTTVLAQDPATREHADGGPPELARLAGGRLVAQYGSEGHFSRLVAVDARSGDVQWDVLLPGTATSGANRMTVSDARIYLPYGDSLHVFDAASGELLAAVGE